MARALLTILASYVIGGIPVAYLTGRLLRGVDIRERGSGNAGASNVWQSVSKAAVVPVGLAEIGQGLLGPAFAIASGQGRAVQSLAGLAAIAGHNWSPFLRFTGGRGVAHGIGFMLAVSRPALAAFIVISLAGVRLRAIPQFVGLGVAAAPFAAKIAGQPASISGGMAGMAAIIFAKRLLANEPPAPPERNRVLLNRLLYDRDTAEREAWVRQEPDA
ncbi:MAG: glycerol-3-phosphate acyltransferase [Chloroflexi bacterium]|nr:glycerol-3-phosphate acyltransferase [Chloroflexota bacterium]